MIQHSVECWIQGFTQSKFNIQESMILVLIQKLTATMSLMQLLQHHFDYVLLKPAFLKHAANFLII